MLLVNVGLMFHPTFGLPRVKNKNDAAAIASIGLVITVFGFLSTLTIASFLLSLYGYTTLVYVSVIVYFSSLILLSLYTKVGENIILNSQSNLQSDRCRKDWEISLKSILIEVDDVRIKGRLVEIIEELKYASSSVFELSTEVDNEISELIDSFQSINSEETEAMDNKINKIVKLLSLRSNILTHR